MENLHLLSLLITIPFILYSDHLGFLYLLGKKETIDLRTTKKLHTAVFIGLSLLYITGFFLTLPAWEFYIKDPLFLLKMFFVLTLTINGFFIGATMKVASNKNFNSLTKRYKATLVLSGLISATCWLGSFIIGYFFL